jgi:hypothetical protein
MWRLISEDQRKSAAQLGVSPRQSVAHLLGLSNLRILNHSALYGPKT